MIATFVTHYVFVAFVARPQFREAASVTHGAQEVGVRALTKERSQPTRLAYRVLDDPMDLKNLENEYIHLTTFLIVHAYLFTRH